MYRGGRGARGRLDGAGCVVNVKSFFVSALASALDLGLATPDDVLRHVTPEVLSASLPRPLWARLLTACVGAPRVDAQLVLETIGVPNLCEHVPAPLIWACIADLGARALGGALPAVASTGGWSTGVASSAPVSAGSGSGLTVTPLSTPPPPDVIERSEPTRAPLPSVMGQSIPAPKDDALGDVMASLDAEQASSPGGRPRSPSQRFRPSNTGVGRLANNPRRPQAQAAPPEPATTQPEPVPASNRPRRGQTEADAYDVPATEGSDGKDDWQASLAVEDEQLVDWQSSEETVSGDEYGRKRS